MRLDELLEQALMFLGALDYPFGVVDNSWEQFPREVGLKREVVKDRYEFGAYFMSCVANNLPAYVALYPQHKLTASFFDVVFLDIDFHENKIHETQLEALGETLVERLRGYLLSLAVLSGRGVHLYFAFPKLSIAKVFSAEFPLFSFDGLFSYEFICVRRMHKLYATNFVKHLIGQERDLFEQISEAGGRPDFSCVGDVRRMVRLPGTVNEKTGGLCRLLYVGVLSQLSVDEKFKKVFPDAVADTFRACRGDMRVEKDVVESDNVLVYKDFYPPCIAEMVGKLAETGELDHIGRLTLASYLLIRGWSEDDVVDVFRAANDFKEHYTRYQVHYLKTRQMWPYKCDRLELEGLCPYRCELYPYMLSGRRRQV
ncbi:MAG: hypothetical protein QXN23_05820 [Candidatus Caldarchaeum sp.]